MAALAAEASHAGNRLGGKGDQCPPLVPCPLNPFVRGWPRAAEFFVSFLPGISDDAKRRIGKTIRAWRINRRSDRTLDEFAATQSWLADPVCDRG